MKEAQALGWLICLLFAHSGWALDASSAPRAVAGELDLRSVDFNRSGPISLDGEWRFFWGEIVPPDEAARRTDAPTCPFPALWNDLEVPGVPVERQGVATYHLRVLTPPGAERLAVALEDAYTAFDFYANGILVGENGVVGTDAASTTPHWLPMTVAVEPHDGVLDLTLVIANFHHRKGGSSQSILLGEFAQMIEIRERDVMADMLLAGALIMGGLFFLGLYLSGSHERSILYFSLFCLVYGYRVGGTQLYTFHALWPHLPWWLTTRLEYLTMFSGVLLFTRYTYSLYPEESHRRVIQGLTVVATACFGAALVLPASIYTALVTPFMILVPVSMVYVTTIYARAVMHHRQGARYALVSTIILVGVGMAFVAYYFVGWHLPQWLNLAGHVGFFFFQSLIMSTRSARVLQLAKERAEHTAKVKTDFLSMISHEIRTPLNGVIGLTNVLMDEDPKPSQRKLLKSLSYSAQQLLAIINALLDFNKIDAGRVEFDLQPTNLRELIEHLQRSQQANAEDKKLTFTTQIDPDVPDAVLCDGTRMGQVLTNLVANALKFTPRGAVTVRALLVSAEDSSATIRFEVEDTGIGIPADKLELIFEDFSQASSATTREFGGTGLGLPISRRLLALQDVDLQVESTVDVGTRFFFTQTFRLPSAGQTSTKSPFLSPVTPPAHGDAAKPDQPTDPGLPPGLRILLVEDNMVNKTVAQRILQRWGAEVDHAPDGQVAVERVRRGDYQVVLMDLQMPVMDGFTAAREIRALPNAVPIIALTATVIDKTASSIAEAGMDGLVIKPFAPQSLYLEITRVLRAAASTEA